ncbi:OVARIAN TUMOR DOMAIN-containing deubiquitinating enzyme 11-like isoform X1 [Actinidia eriantha]|uniref:OVARIAN TUMOR DOMAIN-containing deubiquitinating enzyme 11-like isoform X1 n=1 Tax=Actinidia eriantha TaxID=165200 RepID=UPI00258E03DD|nr:OVARIAN TUMOR DOMAIN-containing deubiquitinating enzyme 11-like isoform X1 [Actinidia eriantha]XP_057473546.1 OVARIAN TUMOR DOMAIN-containing deubiquitinating enzyme 11-like isoform X1 [Actinidia eriantha]XP_057473547.1 OVARIAN TUMOR DOMAIN-containing deubiquitinating enzyme 11-like isoform X1 [Actinidia eriantha]
MTENFVNARTSSSSSLNSSSHDTEDDHVIATILAEEECSSSTDRGKLGKRLKSGLDPGWPHMVLLNCKLREMAIVSFEPLQISCFATLITTSILSIPENLMKVVSQ